MSKKTKIQTDTSTEEKIKDAARRVFTKKGYAATRTRDIAEEAGLNLALLNYYFRSKEKLFDQIMMEKIQKLFGFLMPTINEPSTSLEKKLELIAAGYIDMLSQTPDLPLFVLSEVRHNPERFATTIQPGKVLRESHFVKQLHEQRPDLHPVHFLMNFLGMILFPFVARPLLMSAGALSSKEFETLMNERKALIPKWINACLKAK